MSTDTTAASPLVHMAAAGRRDMANAASNATLATLMAIRALEECSEICRELGCNDLARSIDHDREAPYSVKL